MKKNLILILILLSLICLTIAVGCEKNQLQESNEVDMTKPYIRIMLDYNADIYSGSIFGKYYPTISVWLEDVENGKTKTIYATKKVATNKWTGGKARPSSLPIWYGILEKESATDESTSDTELDAISSATVSGSSVELLRQIPEEFINRDLNIYLEANCSFDYNDYYKKNLKEGQQGFSDVNGQPSILFKGTLLTTDDAEMSIIPEIVGTGDVLGKDHKVYTDTSKITTAKQIFSKIVFEWQR